MSLRSYRARTEGTRIISLLIPLSARLTMTHCVEYSTAVGSSSSRNNKLYCDACWVRWHLNALARRESPGSQCVGERAQEVALLCHRLKQNDPSLQRLVFECEDSKVDLWQLLQLTSAFAVNTTVKELHLFGLEDSEAFAAGTRQHFDGRSFSGCPTISKGSLEESKELLRIHGFL